MVKEVISNESGSDPRQWLLGASWVESRSTGESTSAALKSVRVLQAEAPQPGLAVNAHPGIEHAINIKAELFDVGLKMLVQDIMAEAACLC